MKVVFKTFFAFRRLRLNFFILFLALPGLS